MVGQNSDLVKTINQVFTYDWSIKPCGRDTCRQLIQQLSVLDDTVDFGSIETGRMNVANIITYCSENYIV